MFLNRKKKAFSLVELMMILLVASLITAALFPVITKKHFRLPMLVNHGAYLCYYKEGKLREAKWAGKMKTKELFDRETDNCVFVPPKKAGYFEISAIGGGGGGGDAGYTGGNWISGVVESTISPFERTEENLKTLGISLTEFKQYAGWVMGYANSIGSGNGGDIGYIYRDDIPHDDCEEYEMKDVHDTAVVEICKAKWENDKCTAYSCTEERKCTTTESDETCYYRTEEKCLKYSDIEYNTVPTGEYKCIGPYQKEVSKAYDVPQCCMAKNGVCQGDKYDCTDGSSGTIDQSTGFREKRCGTRHVDAEYEQACTSTEPIMKTVSTGGDCIKKEGGDLVPYTCKKSHTTCETITHETPIDSITNRSDCIAGGKTTVELDSTHKESTGVCKPNKEMHWTEYEYNKSIQYGESGGSGAKCHSIERHGDLGLKGTGISTIYSSDVKNGDDVDAYSYEKPSNGQRFFLLEKNAGFGTASCYPRSILTQKCENPSFATYTISGDETSIYNKGNTIVKAVSAAVGGNGGSRTIISGDDIDPYMDGHERNDVAVDGYCTGDFTTSRPNCTGSGYYGYCLIHHYDTTTAETNGLYEYNFGRDLNYLGYGEAGYPGEFKTKIIRSLKGIDTTIKVGRGGSAAALNSGSQGISGSETAFGDILIASGGSGGRGNQIQESEELPVYDAERYKKESRCYYYDVAYAKNKDGSYVHPDSETKYKDIRDTINEEPTYCSGLINQLGNYKFFRLSNNNKAGDYPTPTGIFSSFLNLAFQKLSGGEESPLAKFTKYGRGGKGGGVEHRCWAGRGEIEFENVYMKASVFVDQASAAANGSNKYVPANCRNDYSNIPAGPGADGAVLIKW